MFFLIYSGGDERVGIGLSLFKTVSSAPSTEPDKTEMLNRC